MAIPMAISMLPELYKMGSGIHQLIKGKRMNPVRPDYEIPDGVLENTAMFRNRANSQRMPGQSMYENQVDANTSNNASTMLNSGVGGAALVASMNATNSQNLGSIDKMANMGMQNQMANQNSLAQANSQQAVYEDKAWDWNKKEKFQEEAAARAALLQAGNQNLHGSMDSLANAYVQSPSMQAAGDNIASKVSGFFKNRFGGGGNEATASGGEAAAQTSASMNFPRLSAGQIGSLTGQGNPMGVAGGTTKTGFGLNQGSPFSSVGNSATFNNPYQYSTQSQGNGSDGGLGQYFGMPYQNPLATQSLFQPNSRRAW